ncbi:MAG: hypothetical protein QW051_02630 [Candidatus Aenigmatarchaeota archaeon]
MFNPFKRKKKTLSEPFEAGLPPGPPMPERRIVPTDEVRALASRGVPEPEIINTLKREGYSPSEIDQAMKEALRSRVAGDFYGPPPAPTPQPYPSSEPPVYSPREEIPPNLNYPGRGEELYIPQPPLEPAPRTLEYPEMPEREYYPETYQAYPQPTGRVRGPQRGIDRREIEELTEVIVEEKIRELKERFKSIDAQFQQFTRKIESINDELNRMRSEKSGEIKAIENKIDGYSRNMEEMAGRIESLEKALRDSIAPMLESLRSLSELVKSLKEKK